MGEETDVYEAIGEIAAEAPSLAEGMERLVEYCRQRYPDPVWHDMLRLDYAGCVGAMQTWFSGQLPIPERVQVIWFALWDVTTGFDLRGSSSWSRDPEDWDWWYHDDFSFGSYGSPVMNAMNELARRAEDPEEGPDVEGGVWELMDSVLTLGYVSLAATHIMRRIDSAGVLGSREELWVVTGHPDALHGIVLGRLTPAGFETTKLP